MLATTLLIIGLFIWFSCAIASWVEASQNADPDYLPEPQPEASRPIQETSDPHQTN